MTSPSLISLNLSRPIPHSKPLTTSRTSSLNRFKLSIFPSKITTLSRSTRASLFRVIFPSVTYEPATVPTLGTLKVAPNFGPSKHYFAVFGFQHSFHGFFHIINNVVDDPVHTKVDFLPFGDTLGDWVRTDVKANDNGPPKRKLTSHRSH